MHLTWQPFELQLNHPFTIAKFSRTSTPLMLVQVHHEGFTGYGEASMVPYMGESHQTAHDFLSRVDAGQLVPFDFDAILTYLDDIAPGNPALKAAIDIALHDLQGKLAAESCWKLLGSSPELMPVTSYTIGIDKPEVIIKKVQAAPEGCKVIKVKLGRDSDRELIKTIRSVTDLPLYVDANQGWTDLQESLDMTHWLHEQGVQLIEQPMPKTDPDSNAWLTERSPVPIIGDESVQRFADVEKAAGIYHGINIKLMKSAGMHEALRMIRKARELNLKILIGCMSETSCATLAAAALAPQCDWADLDGPFLVSNNPYRTPDFKDGKWQLNNRAGLGLELS